MKTILEYWNDAFNYYCVVESFDASSDADFVTANHICKLKPKWSFERSCDFMYKLKFKNNNL